MWLLLLPRYVGCVPAQLCEGSVLSTPYERDFLKEVMAFIFGVGPGVFAAWIVSVIPIVLALLYPLITEDKEGD